MSPNSIPDETESICRLVTQSRGHLHSRPPTTNPSHPPPPPPPPPPSQPGFPSVLASAHEETQPQVHVSSFFFFLWRRLFADGGDGVVVVCLFGRGKGIAWVVFHSYLKETSSIAVSESAFLAVRLSAMPRCTFKSEWLLEQSCSSMWHFLELVVSYFSQAMWFPQFLCRLIIKYRRRVRIFPPHCHSPLYCTTAETGRTASAPPSQSRPRNPNVTACRQFTTGGQAIFS